MRQLPYGEEEKKKRLLELGSRVRAKREELGLSMDQVSEKTKIRSKYLVAVEEGDDSVSPGRTYFRAFLKTYASSLGLDGIEFSRIYREIVKEAEVSETARPREPRPRPASDSAAEPTSTPTPKTPANVPTALPSATTPAIPSTATESARSKDDVRRRPGRPRRRMPGERRRKNGAVWVFLALAAIAAIVYYVAANKPEPPAEPGSVGTLPADNPPAELPTMGTGEVAEPPITLPVEQEPAGPEVKREDPNPERTVWSVDRSPVEVTLKLTKEPDSFCWVRVTVDGEFSFERTLTPEEEVALSAASEIAIRAGKPWVMNVQINGQDMGLAGEFGPVKDLVFRSTTSTE